MPAFTTVPVMPLTSWRLSCPAKTSLMLEVRISPFCLSVVNCSPVGRKVSVPRVLGLMLSKPTTHKTSGVMLLGKLCWPRDGRLNGLLNRGAAVEARITATAQMKTLASTSRLRATVRRFPGISVLIGMLLNFIIFFLLPIRLVAPARLARRGESRLLRNLLNKLQLGWNAGPFGPRSGRAKVLEYTLKSPLTLANFGRLFSLIQPGLPRFSVRSQRRSVVHHRAAWEALPMNFGRVVLAALGGFLAYFVLGGLLFAALPTLKNEFMKYPAVYRPQAEIKSVMPAGMVAMFVGMLVLAVLDAMIYRGGSGFLEGARFGALIGLFAICAFVIHNYVNLNIGLSLTIQQSVAYFVEWVATGIVIGLIYRPLR